MFFVYIETCIYKSNKLLYHRQSYPAPIYACGLADIKLKNMAKELQNADDVILAAMKLEIIQAGLPKGYQTTNKRAVRKTVREIGSTCTEIFWTSWCQNCTSKGLALLKPNGAVKIILEKDYQNYEVNGKPLGH